MKHDVSTSAIERYSRRFDSAIRQLKGSYFDALKTHFVAVSYLLR